MSEVLEGKRLSRRELLTGAGKLAVGASAIAVVLSKGLGLPPRAEAKELPKWPWPYKKLDIDKVAEITYTNWYKGFCCYAVASGILIPLQEKVGEPYTSFPVDSLVWGHGGVVGWGTMCGTMIGTSIATGLICGPGVAKDGEQVANEVIHFYADTELTIYAPKTPKTTGEIAKSKSNSPLCHISVGKWMKEEGVEFLSPQRFERCARITADVAIRTVTLLNDWYEGKYKPVHDLQVNLFQMPTENKCSSCHGSKVPEVPL